MRSAEIYYDNLLAGILNESDDGEYKFTYTREYVENHPDQFLTFTMPVSEHPCVSNRLFPVFEGLIPEGWLLDIATKNWKISQNDQMGLLLACCKNCIGALSVVPVNEGNHE